MKRKLREPIEIKYEEPEHWKEVYDKISEMRKEKLAPVDTMGCASFKKDCDPKEGRVNTLWSLMLSSQTKDAMTAEAMRNLTASGSKVTDIMAYSDAELDQKIAKVGFHNKKVGYLKATAKILHDTYDDDIPDTIEGMLALPGVGKKMAYLLMTHAWNKTMGIGVDVHVHRISNRLGWVHTNTPEETRVALEGWLPKEYWGQNGVNKLLVGFGQTVCLPIGPKCSQCQVNHLCPSAFKESKKEKTIKKEIKTEIKSEKSKKKSIKKEKKTEIKSENLNSNISQKKMKNESIEIKNEPSNEDKKIEKRRIVKTKSIKKSLREDDDSMDINESDDKNDDDFAFEMDSFEEIKVRPKRGKKDEL